MECRENEGGRYLDAVQKNRFLVAHLEGKCIPWIETDGPNTST
jgi:hypothetical protein